MRAQIHVQGLPSEIIGVISGVRESDPFLPIETLKFVKYRFIRPCWARSVSPFSPINTHRVECILPCRARLVKRSAGLHQVSGEWSVDSRQGLHVIALKRQLPVAFSSLIVPVAATAWPSLDNEN